MPLNERTKNLFEIIASLEKVPEDSPRESKQNQESFEDIRILVQSAIEEKGHKKIHSKADLTAIDYRPILVNGKNKVMVNMTAAASAACSNDVSIFKFLVDSGIDCHNSNRDQKPYAQIDALMATSFCGASNILKYLLDKFPDIELNRIYRSSFYSDNEETIRDVSPLYAATVLYDYPSVTQLLLFNGADPYISVRDTSAFSFSQKSTAPTESQKMVLAHSHLTSAAKKHVAGNKQGAQVELEKACKQHADFVCHYLAHSMQKKKPLSDNNTIEFFSNYVAELFSRPMRAFEDIVVRAFKACGNDKLITGPRLAERPFADSGLGLEVKNEAKGDAKNDESAGSAAPATKMVFPPDSPTHRGKLLASASGGAADLTLGGAAAVVTASSSAFAPAPA